MLALGDSVVLRAALRPHLPSSDRSPPSARPLFRRPMAKGGGLATGLVGLEGEGDAASAETWRAVRTGSLYAGSTIQIW